MPAIGNIAITDAESTPVTHTFAPVTTDGNMGKLANRSASIPKGFELLELEVAPASNPNSSIRVRGKFNFPTVGTVDGAAAVLRESRVEFTFYLSQLSTSQERKNYAKLVSNLLNHATFVSMIENVEPVY